MPKTNSALGRVRKYFPNVKKVNDATKGITIEVTPEDVAGSKRKQHAECAMAVAAKRTTGCSHVIIARATAYLINGDTATRYKPGEAVAREVISFDRGAVFEPGIYRLGVPEHKLGEQDRNVSPKRRNVSGRKRGQYHLTTNVRTILGSDKES